MNAVYFAVDIIKRYNLEIFLNLYIVIRTYFFPSSRNEKLRESAYHSH